jgi:hypothetical protein
MLKNIGIISVGVMLNYTIDPNSTDLAYGNVKIRSKSIDSLRQFSLFLSKKALT